MTYLSLRSVISATSAALVLLVASATLAVLLTSTTASLRDIGSKHVEGLIDTVRHRTIALFEPSFVTLDNIANFSRSADWAWPSDDPLVSAAFLQRLDTLYQVRKMEAPGVIVYFWDNTRLSVSAYNNTHYKHHQVWASPISSTALEDQTFNRTTTEIDFTNRFQVTEKRLVLNTVEERMRDTSLEQLLMTMTVSGRQASISGILDRSTENGNGNFFVESYVTMAQPIFRGADAATTANLFGIAVTSLYIEDMNQFLAASRATPNTAAFATDTLGYLYGSSILSRPIRTISDAPPGTGTSRLGCSTTDSIGAISYAPNQLVCRSSHLTYGHAALAAMPLSSFRRREDSIEITKLAGETYFVATVRVPMRLPGMPIQLVLLMPEADVIGDVVQSRNVAIGIVAALVVVAAVINFVVISVLLSPLEGVAARMRKAANLEDDAEEESVSAMAEVAALQEAYYEMNDELNRIRSFVPQSVLLAKKNAMETTTEGGLDAEEDDEGDLDLSGNGVADVGRRNTVNAAALSGLANSSGPSLGNSGGSRAGSRGNLLRASGEDVQSQISRRSSRSMAASSHRGASGGVLSKGAVALANLSLKPRVVTIVAANLCGFLSQVSNALNKDATVAHITDLVDFVYRTVSKHGGVVASYHGDHFVATFNAVKVCGAHALGAARAATLLTDGADGVGFGSALRVGVATGRCQVGNLGNKEVKAFSTVGPAYQHACVLERMGRLYGDADERSVLATRRTCADIATQFRFRFVDVVALPGRERGGAGATITPIATLLGPAPAHVDGQPPADAGDDEWLYVVNSTATGDVNALWNEAFNKLSYDDLQSATDLVQQYRDKTRPSASCADERGANPDSGTAKACVSPATAVTVGDAEVLEDPQHHLPMEAARSPIATDNDWARFDALCRIPAAASRFRDLGEFYTAAYSV